jgi:hypothetical protein
MNSAMEENNGDNLLPIAFKNWKETKFISGRIAGERDIENGFAAFTLNNVENHKAEDIDLPTLARLIDYNEINDDYHELVIVIQFECTSEYGIVGYRKFNGETGSCLPYDLNFLRDSEIEEFNLLINEKS